MYKPLPIATDYDEIHVVEIPKDPIYKDSLLIPEIFFIEKLHQVLI